MTLRVNITTLVRDRVKLAKQTVRSIVEHTDLEYHNWSVLDDGSNLPFNFPEAYENREISLVRNIEPTGGAGPARNQVINNVETVFGRAELLYLGDSDCYHTPRWLDLLCELWPQAYAEGFRVIGGYQHPFNRTSLGAWPQYSEVMGRTMVVHETLAVATQSWLMDWETWDKYGPFAEAPGVRQSEDVDMCKRIRADGDKVGYVWPPCVLNCSLTDTFGAEVPGAELLRGEMQEGIVYE